MKPKDSYQAENCLKVFIYGSKIIDKTLKNIIEHIEDGLSEELNKKWDTKSKKRMFAKYILEEFFAEYNSAVRTIEDQDLDYFEDICIPGTNLVIEDVFSTISTSELHEEIRTKLKELLIQDINPNIMSIDYDTSSECLIVYIDPKNYQRPKSFTDLCEEYKKDCRSVANLETRLNNITEPLRKTKEH